MSAGVFDPSELEVRCRRDMAGALRTLAEHLDRNEISVSLWNLQGNGFVQDPRREHFLMTLDVACTLIGGDRTQDERLAETAWRQLMKDRG